MNIPLLQQSDNKQNTYKTRPYDDILPSSQRYFAIITDIYKND